MSAGVEVGRVEVRTTVDPDVFESIKDLARIHTGDDVEAYVELLLLRSLRPTQFEEATAGKSSAAA